MLIYFLPDLTLINIAIMYHIIDSSLYIPIMVKLTFQIPSLMVKGGLRIRFHIAVST